MPQRTIRDWTDSEPVNALSAQAERVFVRLIMKADVFGRYTANVRLLRASLFPLTLDAVRETDMQRWIAECEKSGLIVLYECDGKPLLEIQRFGQRIYDDSKPQFPAPPEVLPDSPCTNPPGDAAGRGGTPGDAAPTNASSSSSSSANAYTDPPQGAADEFPRFAEFWNWFPAKRKAGRTKAFAVWKKQGLEAKADDVLLGLTRWLKSRDWAEDKGKFIPGPVPWLNGEKWEALPDPADPTPDEIDDASLPTAAEVIAFWASESGEGAKT